MEQRLEGNIWKYALILIANKRIYAAILGAYYLTIPNVTVQWIGFFFVIGNAASFILDVPSSYLADKIGHKYALVLARVFHLTATLMYLLATNLVWIIVGTIFSFAGFAFQTGVGSAFMHETLRQLGREDEFRTVTGKASSIGFAVPAVLAMLIPFSMSISYRAPFVIALILDMVGVFVALSLVRPTVTAEHLVETHRINYLQVVRQGLLLRFFRVAVFSSIVSSLLDGMDNFRSVYQISLGVPVIWFGVFFGIGRGLAALMLAYSGKIHRFIGDVHSYQRMQIVVYATLLLIVATTANPWIIVAALLLDNGLQYGLSQIDTGYMLDIIRDSKFKATLLSTNNQIENALSMVVVLVMGILIQRIGFKPAFGVLSVTFIAVLVPLYFYNLQTKTYGTSRTS